MRLRTPLTELIGIEHPVVQTGMGWVAGARLVSATANAGGLGILASATMTLDELATAIGKVKAATDKPFGVNIRADAGDADDRVDLMIREGVKVASFALAPNKELITKLKGAGAVVIPSVGLAKHARKVASWGADAVIVQGGEGGGHTGPVATTLLLPSVLDAVSIPVIAAGGFFDGRGLAAALSYGAAGVAMGTRFLLTSDSTVPDAVKQRYLQAGLDGTVVTTRVDGMPHRVLRTGLVEKLESGSRARGSHRGSAERREVQEDVTDDLGVDGSGWSGHAARQGTQLVASGDGRQHPDVAQSRPGRGQYRRRRAGFRPGRRHRRGPAVVRGADPDDRRRGRQTSTVGVRVRPGLTAHASAPYARAISSDPAHRL